MRIFYTIVFLSLAFFMACQEIEDPSKEASPPLISIDFQSDSTIVGLELEVEKADSIVDTLLIKYNQLLEDESPDTAEARIAYQGELVVADSLNELYSLLKSNKVQLDSVYALHEASEIIVDTTNSVFKLPLDMNAENSTFIFHYLRKVDTLSFNYKTRVSAGLEKIYVVAYDISIAHSSFENYSRLYCHDENCTSSEIVYEVVF